MYQLVLSKKAKKFMDKMPPVQRARVVVALEKLPESGDIKPMVGKPGLLRLRVGDYRVIYTVDGGRLIVLVLEIGNRGDVYK